MESTSREANFTDEEDMGEGGRMNGISAMPEDMLGGVHGKFTYGVGDIGVGHGLSWAGPRDLNLA